MCEFQEYTVSKYGDKPKVEGKVWKDALSEIKDSILKRKDIVITIVGAPGMGKTTLLNAVYDELKESYVIYLDLVNSTSLSSSAWNFILMTKLNERIRTNAFNLLYDHKEEIGYTGFARIREFPNWLRHLCLKEAWSEAYGYAERLYCMKYSKDVDGLIEFLKDLQNLGAVGLLLDEMKAEEGLLKELHKLINEVKLPIIVTMTPDVISKINDSALVRRLTERQIELKLNYSDKVDILKVYCEEYYKELSEIEEVTSASSVSQLLDKARIAYKNALDKCKDEYKKEECIRRELTKAFDIDDPMEASRQLEDKIREGLLELKNELGITLVHTKGRRIKDLHVIVDIYFETANAVYIGDIKLSNKDTLNNIENVKKLEKLDHYNNLPVKKFIVTNQTNVNIKNFKLIYVSNEDIKRIIEGDKEKRNELVRRIMEI